MDLVRGLTPMAWPLIQGLDFGFALSWESLRLPSIRGHWCHARGIMGHLHVWSMCRVWHRKHTHHAPHLGSPGWAGVGTVGEAALPPGAPGPLRAPCPLGVVWKGGFLGGFCSPASSPHRKGRNTQND